jgi:hypothetical protein
VAAIAATFINDAFYVFLALAGAFLDASNQLIFFAMHKLQVVIRELRKFLFQLAFGNIPGPFHCQHAHNLICWRYVLYVTPRFVKLFARDVPPKKLNCFFGRTSKV